MTNKIGVEQKSSVSKSIIVSYVINYLNISNYDYDYIVIAMTMAMTMTMSMAMTMTMTMAMTHIHLTSFNFI